MLGRWAAAIRRNHALEHATVAVLLARHGPMRVAGRASLDGFLLFADVESGEIMSAAGEALQRLQAGQSDLAVSPLCGTNIAVAGLAAAAAATAAFAIGPVKGRFPNTFIASMLAVIASPLLGRTVQERITTRADVDRVELVGAHTVLGLLRKVTTRGAQS